VAVLAALQGREGEHIAFATKHGEKEDARVKKKVVLGRKGIPCPRRPYGGNGKRRTRPA